MAVRGGLLTLPRPVLVAELGLIFFGLPALYAWLRPPMHVLAVLWVVTGCCLVSLLFDPTFDRRRLGRWRVGAGELRRLAVRLVIVGLVLAGIVFAVAPDRLFDFPRARPALWALVMVFYPLLSVVPQGITYRAFFFHRYRSLFGDGPLMIAASAIAFCFGHVVFGNAVALVLTAAGGLMFARTYARTGSLPFSCLEHALYGCLAFTLGLGRYLYLGS
ncbi:MAG: CPBP family intramembrane metalloprotease [Acidobacteria bacterium]|nr:MAG: CPBP family intramembrane metalloprotease [Acidobacteriota bacterium]